MSEEQQAPKVEDINKNRTAIWKYVINPTGITELDIPIVSDILAVQAQRNSIAMWVMVDSEALLGKRKRKFIVITTGMKFEQRGKSYIGTVQLDDGDYVVHVFEMKK